jgi:two-component system, sensor histidine kinase and response regulator
METTISGSEILTNQSFKVLVVDDDPVDRMAVVRAFKGIDFETELLEAIDYASAISLVNSHQFDCIFVDYRLPDGNGLELVKTLRKQGIHIPIVSLTGQSDDLIAVELMKAGASDYLSKSKVSPARLRQVFQNVMRVYQAEQVAELANRQREELLGQKEEFISRMTHDLQTPLVAANRMLDLIGDDVFGEVPPKVKLSLATIVRSNQDLLQMVRNIVEAYTYDTKTKQFDLIAVDLTQIVNEIVQELTPLAIGKNVELSAIMSDSHPDWSGSSGVEVHQQEPHNLNFQIDGDRLELKRLIINLVGNSLKFTDAGKVLIELTPSTLDCPWVNITVSDTGTGIDPADRVNLFERFRRGKHKRSNSGLGLYLCKQIAEAHHGKISVISTPGEGSTFTIILPASTSTVS